MLNQNYYLSYMKDCGRDLLHNNQIEAFVELLNVLAFRFN